MVHKGGPCHDSGNLRPISSCLSVAAKLLEKVVATKCILTLRAMSYLAHIRHGKSIKQLLLVASDTVAQAYM